MEGVMLEQTLKGSEEVSSVAVWKGVIPGGGNC